jgi:hypothetical protein
MASTVVAQITYGLSRREVTRSELRALGPALLLLLLPFAIAFGTFNDLVKQTGASIFSILLASAVVARVLFEPAEGRAVQVGLSGAAFCLVAYSSFVPYGLPTSIVGQGQPLALPFSKDQLSVDATTKRYVDGLRSVATREGLTADTPIIDLSGRGPGTALLLGGRMPGYPWLIAGYANSPHVVDAVRGTMTEREWQRTWIIGPIDATFASSRLVAELERSASRYRCVANLSMVTRGTSSPTTVWKPSSGSDEPVFQQPRPSSVPFQCDLAAGAITK